MLQQRTQPSDSPSSVLRTSSSKGEEKRNEKNLGEPTYFLRVSSSSLKSVGLPTPSERSGGSAGKFFHFINFILLLLLPHLTLAQSDDFPYTNFQNISTKDGLSQNSVGAIMQDTRGFMWFTTQKGLDRFDGIEFRNYSYNPSDSNSLSPGYFYSLCEDRKGIFWLSSSTEGFYSFNPSSEKFTHYRHQTNNSNSLVTDFISNGMLLADSSGIIWISTSNGLNAFDPRTNEFRLYRHSDNDSASLNSNDLSSMCLDDENNLWIVCSGNCVDHFNTKTGKVMQHFHAGSKEISCSGQPDFLFVSERCVNGNIWIGSSDGGISGYNLHSKEWIHIQHHLDSSDNATLAGNNLNSIDEDRNGNLWIALDKNRMDYFNPASGKFFHINLSNYNKSGAIEGYSVYEDRSGKIWIAGGNGIITCDPRTKIFHSVLYDPNLPNPLPSNSTISFCKTHDGKFFIGCGNGVVLFDEKNETLTPFVISENGVNIFENNYTWEIYEDSKNNLWFCTLYGLVFYDPLTHSHKLYEHNENDSASLNAESATEIIETVDTRFWVTTFGGGLDLLDPSTGKFRHIKFHDSRGEVSGIAMQGLMKYADGKLLIGTQSYGLILFNPADETSEFFRHDAADPSSLSSDVTMPLTREGNGVVWIGTKGGGLVAFDAHTQKFRAFTMQEGLPGNEVVSMITDDDGVSWIGTTNGISRCKLPQNPFDDLSSLREAEQRGNPQKEEAIASASMKNRRMIITSSLFRNYNMSDGLPGNELAYLGAFKTSGKIYFSGEGGFFWFNPDEMRDNPFMPPVYITGLNVLNKPVAVNDETKILSSAIEGTKEIVLSYEQRVFSFTFSALNFIHTEKNQYAYQLDNFDKDWVYTDAAHRTATYTNLDAGDYVFRVKASNNDGLWNEAETSIHVIILPPWWQTWWFRLLCVLIAGVIIYLIVQSRLQKLKDIRRIRNKIASDLHDDLGATLSSISIMSEIVNQQIRNQLPQTSTLLEKIGSSSRSMIENVNDMVWAINPKNDSFENIIKRMKTFASEILGAKDINFNFDFDKNLLQSKMKMDARRNFYLIFKEAINNIAKYSEAANAFVMVLQRENNLKMTIRDDGIGFDMALIQHGNGLNNMQQRAAEMRAQLKIESITNKGTSVELLMKL